MNKHYPQILLTAILIPSGVFLSGCIGGEDAPPPEKPETQEVAPLPAKETPPPEDPEMRFAKDLIANQDCVRAFQIFQKRAAEGNAEAEAWLGRCYMNGFGTERDTEKAHEFFAKAAEKNDPWGINGLGVCSQYGWGTAVNLQTAMSLYKRAADLKHPLGTLNLARTYADKEGGFFDAQLAETCFRKALELDAPSAKSAFASFLCEQKRYNEAVPLLRESLDEPLSMALMADCLQNGWGVPVDIAKAVDLAEKQFRKFGAARWSADLCFEAGLEEMVMNGVTETAKRRFKCAADQGHAEAQYQYAKILAEANDNDGALGYMLKSADRGNYKAMLDVGEMLVERKDYRRAIKYFMLAYGNQNTRNQAVANLSEIYHYKLKTPETGLFWDIRGDALGIDFCRNELARKEIATPGDEHFSKAAALFAEGRAADNKFASKWLADILSGDYDRLRSLADNNNPDALFALGIVGCMEENGHPNIPVGIELLEKSAELRHATACRFLGDIYRIGKLADKDLKKAMSWYQKGAEYGDAESARVAALMLCYEDEFKDTKLEDFQKAFDKAMELEVTSVAFEYGQIMEYLGKDPKKAETLYRLSAEYGDPRAMLRLHNMLFQTNAKEAIDFIWRAVNANFSEAELVMGDIQRSLECPRNAFIHYLRANIHGDNVHALYRLAECWLTGYGCEINLNCFWNCANEAYKNGSADVCHLLGSVYRDGKICPRDAAKAKAYFEEGAKRGSEDCRKALKEL